MAENGFYDKENIYNDFAKCRGAESYIDGKNRERRCILDGRSVQTAEMG